MAQTDQGSSTNVETTPGPNPSKRRVNPLDTIYEVWKAAPDWQKPEVEMRLLQYLRRYAAKVCWLVLRSYRSDLVEDVAVDAILALPEFQNKSLFSTWFHARAKHRFIDEVRFQVSRKEQSLEGAQTRRALHVVQAPMESSFFVEELLSRLSEEDRAFVDMKVQHGCSDAEIAAELGISRQAVQYQWTRLRNKLRKLYRNGTKTSK